MKKENKIIVKKISEDFTITKFKDFNSLEINTTNKIIKKSNNILVKTKEESFNLKLKNFIIQKKINTSSSNKQPNKSKKKLQLFEKEKHNISLKDSINQIDNSKFHDKTTNFSTDTNNHSNFNNKKDKFSNNTKEIINNNKENCFLMSNINYNSNNFTKIDFFQKNETNSFINKIHNEKNNTFLGNTNKKTLENIHYKKNSLLIEKSKINNNKIFDRNNFKKEFLQTTNLNFLKQNNSLLIKNIKLKDCNPINPVIVKKIETKPSISSYFSWGGKNSNKNSLNYMNNSFLNEFQKTIKNFKSYLTNIDLFIVNITDVNNCINLKNIFVSRSIDDIYENSDDLKKNNSDDRLINKSELNNILSGIDPILLDCNIMKNNTSNQSLLSNKNLTEFNNKDKIKENLASIKSDSDHRIELINKLFDKISYNYNEFSHMMNIFSGLNNNHNSINETLDYPKKSDLLINLKKDFYSPPKISFLDENYKYDNNRNINKSIVFEDICFNTTKNFNLIDDGLFIKKSGKEKISQENFNNFLVNAKKNLNFKSPNRKLRNSSYSLSKKYNFKREKYFGFNLFQKNYPKSSFEFKSFKLDEISINKEKSLQLSLKKNSNKKKNFFKKNSSKIFNLRENSLKEIDYDCSYECPTDEREKVDVPLSSLEFSNKTFDNKIIRKYSSLCKIIENYNYKKFLLNKSSQKDFNLNDIYGEVDNKSLDLFKKNDSELTAITKKNSRNNFYFNYENLISFNENFDLELKYKSLSKTNLFQKDSLIFNNN